MTHKPAPNAGVPLPHPDDLAVDRMATAMKEHLAARRAGPQGDWRDSAQADVEDVAAALMTALAAGHAIDAAVRCMQLVERGANPTLLGAAWYACSTSLGEPTGGSQAAPPTTLFGALMDLYWQVKLANDQSVGQLEPVFEYETDVISRLLGGDLFTAKAAPPVIDPEAVEPGVVASLATIKAVSEARGVVREGSVHVAQKVHVAIDRLLAELAAARRLPAPSPHPAAGAARP
jgi:hypothetical protein